MKPCPFCAEEIQDTAIVCKHCGRDLKTVAPTRIRSNPAAIGCLVIIGIVGLLMMIGWLVPSRDSTQGTSAVGGSVDLDASVQFDGTQFTVKNAGTADWLDVRCTLNRSGFFGDGFEYHVKRLDAGESFKVGAMQFAKPDGTRFNPFQTKPTSMAISAKLNSLSGPSGFYYGKWE